MIKDSAIYLYHILDAIKSIEKCLQGETEEQFHMSEEKQVLVVHRFEIIGEATKNIPDEFKQQHSDIPWRQMAGMRDILIHHYFDINFSRVWEAATQHIPPLKEKIQHLINAPDEK